MANIKTKRTKSSRFGRGVRRASGDQSLHRRHRPRLELLETRLAPSVYLSPPTDPGATLAAAHALAKGGDRLPAGVPLKLDSNHHVVFGPYYQLADFLSEPTASQLQLVAGTGHTPVLGPQQMPNDHQDVGSFRVNPDGTVSPSDPGQGANSARLGQTGPILVPHGQAPQSPVHPGAPLPPLHQT